MVEDRRSLPHADAETLAAFVDGALGRRESRRVVQHLASCEECSHMVAEAARVREERERQPIPHRTISRRVIVLTGSLAASVLVLVLVAAWMLQWGPGSKTGGVTRGVGPLVSALAERRTVDARLSGGFEWAPLEPIERSGAEGRGTRNTPMWEVQAAAGAIDKEAQANPTPANLHALGIAHLVLGDLDDAVSVLRKVARDPGAGAKPVSDLAAALLERGERKGRPEDLMEALSFVEEALRRDPSLDEALFNRAVALEKLRLDDRAVAAWEDYLRRSPAGGWSDEARRRLERLKAAKDTGSWEEDRGRIEDAIARGDGQEVDAIVAKRTQETRLWIEEELLGAWAEAAGRGEKAAAEASLATAETLAGSLFAAIHDPATRDAVAWVRARWSARDASLPAAIRGLAAVREGAEHYAKYDIDEAYGPYEEAVATLGPVAAPSAVSASYGLGRCEYYRGVKSPAIRARARGRADAVGREAERKGYLAIAAEAHWLAGLIALGDGRVAESLLHYRLALDGFRHLHEEENTAFLSALLAETYMTIGDAPESLRLAVEGVGGLPRVRVPAHALVILEESALAASRAGFVDAALQFQETAVEKARVAGDAGDIADALVRRATIALDAHRPDAAAADVGELPTWLGRVDDDNVRVRLEAEGRWIEGRLARAKGRTPEAIAALGAAIDLFRGANMTGRLPRMLLDRARASVDAGDAAAARRDLEAGISIFETHRKGFLDEGPRVSYFDTSHDLFDELVKLEVGSARPEQALAALERGKTRSLLDRWGKGAQPDPKELVPPLPPGVTVVEYGVLEDRLLLWTMSRGGRHLTERAVSAGDLASLVDAFREDLERAGGVRSEESGSRLSEVLLDPISDRIRGADTLVFVPDEVLHAVPFAALTDPGTRRYLVENHAIVVAPSFSLFLHATGRAALDAGAPTSILAVGDPAFDAAAFPSVPRLPMAAAESEKIASLYPDSLVLTAEAATRSRFLEALGSHSVVHVAAHAIGSDADPLRSRLLLAPDPARHDPGTLFADELSTRSFDNVRLVVLAACSTASGKISRGEGPLSLVRPFLAGGVPVVVATLWEIEDASSAELLVRFHRGVAAGRAPEEALREAQVAMIGAENDAERGPHTWAAFEVVGGVSAGVPAERKEI